MVFDTLRRWLNPCPETRAGYTDVLTQAILSRATGVDSIYSGALEIAAGTVSRAFASAVPTGPAARYFTATVLGEIGRDLIEVGESVWGIGADSLCHLPAMDVDPPGQTLHLRYSTDVHSGRGIGPLGRANALVNLANTLESSLAKEKGTSCLYIAYSVNDFMKDQTILGLKGITGV